MTKLATYYHVCEYRKPDEGISGQIESYFEEEKRYNESFPENQIKKPIGKNLDHVVFKYLESWSLNFLFDRTVRDELNKNTIEYYSFIKWYAIVDVYNQLQNWKEKVFDGTWREWLEFLDSTEFANGVIKNILNQDVIFTLLLPKKEADPRNFYKSAEARKKFEKNSGSFPKFKLDISRANLRGEVV
ncbi:MAG: hypothetical protein IPN88_09090 [Bacteroidetes bacterium]|nr:hypothetical protein [Bacteroidota bacterium]